MPTAVGTASLLSKVKGRVSNTYANASVVGASLSRFAMLPVVEAVDKRLLDGLGLT